MKKKIIAIVGATSAPGQGLTRAILNDPTGEFTARAVTRDVNSEEARVLASLGVEVIGGYVGDPVALNQAFAGAYGAFYIQIPAARPQPEKDFGDARLMAQAAKQAGVEHVVWATLEDSDQSNGRDDEVTPVFFADGRRVGKAEAATATNKPFVDLGVPATFLQTRWHSSVVSGKWAGEIGKCAYGIFRSRELIGKTVSISAGQLALQLAHSEGAVAPVGAASSRRKRLILGAGSIALGFMVVAAVFRCSDGGNGDDRSGAARHAAVAPSPPPVVVSLSPQALPKGVVHNVHGAHAPTETASRSQGERELNMPIAMRVTMPPSPAPSQAATPHVRRQTVPTMKRRARSEDPNTEAEEALLAAPQPPPPPREAPTEAAEPRSETRSASTRSRQAPAPTPAPVVAAAPAAASVRAVRPVAELPPGTIDPRDVAATVRVHAPEVRECFERALMDGSELRGHLTVRAAIDRGGHVLSVSPTSTNIESGARLQACVLGAFKTWTFPPPAAGVGGHISYSFKFE